MQALYDHPRVFNTDTPVGLQNKVIFEIIFYLCRRGQENLREMDQDTFTVKRDGNGRKYIQQKSGEQDKNHRVDDNGDQSTGEGRIYETKDRKCPVASYEKYVSKLPKGTDQRGKPVNNSLWMKPLDSFIDSDAVWYCNMAIGKNTLVSFMSTLSQKAGLSMKYTNHCIRATNITELDRAGFDSRHIMRVTGHKNAQSIASYAVHLSEAKKQDISDALSALRGDGEDVEEGAVAVVPAKRRMVENTAAAAVPSTSARSTGSPNHLQFNNCSVEIHYHK